MTVRIFVSYSHREEVWKQRLMPLLQGFADVKVDTWSDKEIRPGERWDKEIKEALKKMDVFVALVSVYFGVSPYIRAVELAEAERRKDEIDILPVYLGEPADGDCDWLKAFQRVPPEAWSKMRSPSSEYDHALKPIREGIRSAVDRAWERKLTANP